MFLLSSKIVYCQKSNYHFRFINLPESFKNQYISLVEEDAAGMLWFVTNNGLHRYDGNAVLTFDMQTNPALPDVSIRYLFADKQNNLWIATRNKLVRFDLQHWAMTVISFDRKEFPSIRDRFVSVVNQGLDGAIYVGFGNGKLYTVKENHLQFIIRLKLPASDTTGSYVTINTIQEEIKGELWLTTGRGQVVKVHHRNQQPDKQPIYYEPPLLRQSSVNFLLFTRSGKCLLSAERKGIFMLNLKDDSLTPISNSRQKPFRLAANGVFPNTFHDNKALLFISGTDTTSRGLTIYDPEHAVFENLESIYPTSLKNSSLRTTRYANGHILIVTSRGIASMSYAPNPFATYISSLENTNSVRTIHKQPGGHLYVASYLDRFIRIDETSGVRENLSDRMVNALLSWKGDSMLAAVDGGLKWYIKKTNRFTPVLKNHPELKGFVLGLYRENDSLIWVGTYAGFYLINPVTNRLVKSSFDAEGVELQQSKIFDILKVGQYRFLATEEGVFRYDMEASTVKLLFNASGDGFARSSYYCLQLINGYIWAGTSGNGIIVFDTAGTIIRKITTANGLASNIVYSLPYITGYVLAGTSNGLSVINAVTGETKIYSSMYDLPASEFNRSAWFVAGDTIYMGTINGLVRFKVEALLKPPSLQSKLCFSFFSTSNKTQTINDYTPAYSKNPDLVIPAGSRSFTIGFGGLDEHTAELNLFYRLNGNKVWQDIGQRREITMVDMAPGSYTIEVEARLSDGRTMGEVLRLPLLIRPRFFQTVSFKGGIVLGCILLIGLIIRYRERSIKREQQLRSRIAGDLHDEVGSALTRIYFKADILIKNDTSLERFNNASILETIATGSQEALSSMSDMVWSIDARYDNSSDLVSRIKEHLAALTDELGCYCPLEISGKFENRSLGQVKRQNIFLIFKEAVTNALKYAPDKKFAVGIVFEEKLLVLKIRNKCPLSDQLPRINHGGHGLQSMQLRADKIKALLHTELLNGEFLVRLEAKI